MGTLFTSIYDLFLVEVRDYKLDKLYNISPANFEKYLQGFLINAIPEFDNCVKNLEDFNTVTGEFAATLDLTEQNILYKLMVIKWLDKEIQDVTQFNLHLNDTDFKHYAESQNLKEKSEYKFKLRETVNQDMTVYGLKHTDWSAWAAGNFITY